MHLNHIHMLSFSVEMKSETRVSGQLPYLTRLVLSCDTLYTLDSEKENLPKLNH